MKPTASETWTALRFGATASFFLFCWFFTSPVINALFALIVLRVFFLFLRDFVVLPRPGLLFLALLCPLPLFYFYYSSTVEPVPYFAVVVINLIIAYVFSNNLLRGRPTILLQFVKNAHLGPEPSTGFANYLWQQCALWSVASLLSAALAWAALMSETYRPLAGKGLITLFLMQVLWFVVSHEIARHRFGRPETWFRSLQLITQRSSWQKLEI